MINIRVDVEAARDFEESLAWYSERSGSAARGFEAEFEWAMQAIQKTPRRYPLLDGIHRFCPM
jgi:hypothetical protein